MLPVGAHVNIPEYLTVSPAVGFSERAPANQLGQPQYGFPNRMVALKGYKKHYSQLVIGGEFLYVPLGTILLRRFSNITLLNKL